MTDLHPRFEEVTRRLEELLNSPRLFVFGRVDVWLKAGADPDLDIYQVCDRLAKNGRWSGSNLSYFDRAVMQSHADRTMPAPVMTPTPKPRGRDYVPVPDLDQDTKDKIERLYAEMLEKGMTVMSVTPQDARRMFVKGLISEDAARRVGLSWREIEELKPEMKKAETLEASA